MIGGAIHDDGRGLQLLGDAIGDLATDLKGSSGGRAGSIADVYHASLTNPQKIVDHRAVGRECLRSHACATGP